MKYRAYIDSVKIGRALILFQENNDIKALKILNAVWDQRHRQSAWTLIEIFVYYDAALRIARYYRLTGRFQEALEIVTRTIRQIPLRDPRIPKDSIHIKATYALCERGEFEAVEFWVSGLGSKRSRLAWAGSRVGRRVQLPELLN